MLRLLPSHESYRTVDGSITDTVEIDDAKRHLQYFVPKESFNIESKDLLDNKPVTKSSRKAQFTPFTRPQGHTKHPIVLDARHTLVKQFLRHTHVENLHQVLLI